MVPLAILLVLALATSAVSLTVTKSRAFAWLRVPIMRRSRWFGELISCPYCFSHWVALGLLRGADFALPLGRGLWFDCLVTWVALVGAAAVVTRQTGIGHD